MKKVELLSPAGDFECLKRAVFGGANAVYFGAKNFNARAKANNFGSDLAYAVAFCHMYDVKAYLTLNTLIEEEQIDELIETIKYALECGVDAFIVQDFGVLNILKNCFSGVEIHSSTQMAVNNYMGAIIAEKMGIKRVVLSRETSLKDIKLIKEKTNLEIEYFIQGALCVCFSGNCYLSSKLFGKSGNKGECLQPCRLPYKAILKGKTIGEGYLLSSKDLCMANRLKELIEAGVDSFKIEGRLRRSGYVAGVTRVYRKILDNNFDVTNGDIQTIKKCFNRGDFTEGYLNGNGNIIDPFIQGHKGIKIGNVLGFEKGKKFNVVKIKTNHKLEKGDGLKFIHSYKEVASLSAMDIRQNGEIASITTTQIVPCGADVHLILDSKSESVFAEEKKPLKLNFKLIANANQPIVLEYEFKDIKGKIMGEVLSEAKKQSLTKQEAKEQLSKLGDTNFSLDKFEIDTNGVFVTKKMLNDLRREAVNLILSNYATKKEVDVDYGYIQKVKQKEVKNNTNATLEITENANGVADFLVVRPKDYNTFDYSLVTHKNAYLYVPSFLRNDDLKLITDILEKHTNLGVYAENIGALYLNKKTILGAKLNLKNSFAVKELLSKNVVAVVLSPEINGNNFENIKNKFDLPIIKSSLDGFDLMTLVHCPIKTLFNNTCAGCKYVNDIVYKMENGTNLKLDRYKLKNCYFVLRQN